MDKIKQLMRKASTETILTMAECLIEIREHNIDINNVIPELLIIYQDKVTQEIE